LIPENKTFFQTFATKMATAPIQHLTNFPVLGKKKFTSAHITDDIFYHYTNTDNWQY